jgi:hypothetical protein
MAIVTTTITPTGVPFPYAGLSDPLRQFTQGAQSETIFQEVATDIPASGAGDNRRISLICTLPRNFAFAVVDCQIALEGETAATSNTWPAAFQLKIQNAANETDSTSLIPIELLSGGESGTRSTDDRRRTWTPTKLPGAVVIPAVGDSVALLLDVINQTANDQAYDLYFYARFLQFTIEQSNHWQVNSPVPVR